MTYPNRNILWTSIFVDELVRAGITDAVIAPGSRSTPLTFAFAARPEIRIHSLIDERGAAFYTLGLAQTSGRPAALVCTSGTAAANFFPAVIEASQSEIPMLILTADRPPELYASGSNQVIDQLKLYGDYPRWFAQIPTPEANPSQHLLASLRTLADRGVAMSLGANGVPGPVHFNFPFRKPLEPVLVDGDVPPGFDALSRADGQPRVQISRPKLVPDPEVLLQLAERIRTTRSGLIICGPRCPGDDFPSELETLSAATGYPVLADPLSNVRFGTHSNLILGGYDTFLSEENITQALPAPELVLRFGDLPTSTALMNYLAKIKAHQVAISTSEHWMDDMFVVNEVIKGHAASVCMELVRYTNINEHQPAKIWQKAESATWQAVSEFGTTFEGAALAQVVNSMPDDSLLYIANSLPIRHLDQFVRPNSKRIRVLGNRGASGIDGTLSSALGAAAGSDEPLVLVTGDLSLYHDLNSLLAFKRCNVKATIVLIHNDGGGIFHRLPAAQFDPPFTELFVTPHGLDFAPAAHMFGVGFRRLNGIQDLGAAVKESMQDREQVILEVHTDSAAGEQSRKSIIKRTQEIFKEIL